MALTKIITDTIDLSLDTTGLKMPKGTTAQRPSGLDTQYLVVAGGGGGGWVGGGGGAGGLLTDSISLSTSTPYSIIIGEGGLASTNGGPTGSPSGNVGGTGENSTFGSIVATGGGGGGSHPSTGATSGGSGGGAASSGSSLSGASASPSGQGNSGGNNSTVGSGYGGGGGGGAGASGANGTSSTGGNGGVGLTTTIINTTIASAYNVGEIDSGNVYFAGGGGACVQDGSNNPPTATFGTGGLGGGADGENNGADTPVSSPANTGGGGGGGGTSKNGTGSWIYGNGGNGGSGVVVIRVPLNYTATFTSGVTANSVSGGGAISPNTSTGDNVWVVTATTDALQTVTFSGTPPTIGETRENTTTGKMEIYTGAKGWRALQQTGQDVGVVPTNNFNTVLWTGDGASSRSITGTGFTPDLVWTKKVGTSTGNNILENTVIGSGTGKSLSSNSTAIAGNFDAYGYISSFDSDGVTYQEGSSGSWPNDNANESGSAYVSWSWKAGGVVSPNNNSVGTITATVSTNQDAGFSIVKYTGSSTLSDTIGTGFTSQADLIIVKNLDSGSASWAVWSSTFSAASETLFLDINSTSSAYTDRFGTVNATTFQAGSNGGSEVNASGNEMIAYCWQSVPGYSLISSYTGTGSATDSPKIYTGFEPAWLMVKRTDSTGAWNINDNKRNTSNPRNSILQANVADQEYTNNAYNINFYNDGFQINNNHGDWNAAGGKYLFICFAS